MYSKIKDEFSYVKDCDSNAVLNTNNKSLEDYKIIRNNLLKNNSLGEEILNLKKELLTLREIVKEIREQR